MAYVKQEVQERYVVQEDFDPDVMESIGQVGDNVSGEALYTEIPGYSFNEGPSCKELMCLGLNPNCLSRISPPSLATCTIPANIINQIA